MTIDEAITYHNKVAHQQIKNGFRSQNDIYDFLQCAKEHKQHAEWLEKLKEYQQLEEQGRLIKLPCNVGYVVYFAHHDRVISSEVLSAKYHAEAENHGVFIRERLTIDVEGVSAEIDFDDIGKTVFLTKSAAEAKLKELRGRENESSN